MPNPSLEFIYMGAIYMFATFIWMLICIYPCHICFYACCKLSSYISLHVVEDTTVHLVLTKLSSVVAPHLDLDSCILSGIATLCASRLA